MSSQKVHNVKFICITYTRCIMKFKFKNILKIKIKNKKLYTMNARSLKHSPRSHWELSVNLFNN